MGPEYSFVIPVLNERETLPELARRLEPILLALDGACEVVLVDDGSTDGPLDRDRSSDSIGRGGERCFDTIAREAGDRATVGIDNGRQQCIVVRSQQIGPVVADPGAKCRRIHHVREQDRSGAHSRSHGVRH